jgi:hypothetical protein
VTQNSASSTAFAYGLATKATIGALTSIGARYIVDTPRDKVFDTVLGVGLSDIRQNINIIKMINKTEHIIYSDIFWIQNLTNWRILLCIQHGANHDDI